jgi:hypothetical protein
MLLSKPDNLRLPLAGGYGGSDEHVKAPDLSYYGLCSHKYAMSGFFDILLTANFLLVLFAGSHRLAQLCRVEART